MNILNLLTKEKHIAGIEINDSVIRIAYFRPNKKVSKKQSDNLTTLPEHELVLIEETIDENIINDGVVANKKLLGEILKSIWTKANLNSHYAIVSIPEDKIYSKIFTFPKTITETQLKEAINLTIDFQLPLKKSDIYVGWENTGDSNTVNEVLISTISKNIANDYIDSLTYADIKVLALESHLASIARSTKTKIGQATLFLKRSLSGATIFILKDNSIRFSRTIPTAFIKDDNFLKDEINRIKTSYESEKNIPIVEFPFINTTILDHYLKYPELNKLTPEQQSKWLIVMGAAIRGEIPYGHDNHISILPIGTEEAYTYQKTTTFIVLMRNMIIGVSIFFLLAFFVMNFFILSLSKTIRTVNSNIPTPTISEDTSQKEARIKNINEITATSAIILSKTPTWNILLDDIYSRVVDGILISNLSIISINEPIYIIGIAQNRDTLNQFKKSLQASAYLTMVELPITNLEQKGDIPFSISFRLKDPSMLYYK